MKAPADTPLVVLSGCSGGGKTTLLAELQTRGHIVIPEAGRRVVVQAQADGTNATPWSSPMAFVRACVSLHLSDLDGLTSLEGPVFLDRSLVDVITYLSFRGIPLPEDLAALLKEPRYAPLVFMVPPWPDIFTMDAERKTRFDTAVQEYTHLRRSYERLGFALYDLPKSSVTHRADLVESCWQS